MLALSMSLLVVTLLLGRKGWWKNGKLDRFLIPKGMMTFFPKLSRVIVDRNLSNHRLIMLRYDSFDYGLTLFRMFSSRFLQIYFVNVVEDFGLMMVLQKIMI